MNTKIKEMIRSGHWIILPTQTAFEILDAIADRLPEDSVMHKYRADGFTLCGILQLSGNYIAVTDAEVTCPDCLRMMKAADAGPTLVHRLWITCGKGKGRSAIDLWTNVDASVTCPDCLTLMKPEPRFHLWLGKSCHAVCGKSLADITRIVTETRLCDCPECLAVAKGRAK